MSRLLALLVFLLVYSACTDKKPEAITASGYRYLLHTEGGERPDSTDFILHHLDIRTSEETIFSTRASRPRQTPLANALQQAREGRPDEYGYLEVLPFMGIGDSATVIIPIDFLKPEQRAPALGDADTLYYDVVVKNIRSRETIEADRNRRKARNEAARERAAEVLATLSTFAETYQDQGGTLDFDTTDSGLRYHHLTEGSGPRAANGLEAEIYYIAALPADGTILEDNFAQGQPLIIPMGYHRAFPGLEEGIKLMHEGGSAILLIPSRLCHADRKLELIPKGADMLYYVELVRVEKVE